LNNRRRRRIYSYSMESRPVLGAPAGEQEVCREQVDEIDCFIKNAFSVSLKVLCWSHTLQFRVQCLVSRFRLSKRLASTPNALWIQLHMICIPCNLGSKQSACCSCMSTSYTYVGPSFIAALACTHLCITVITSSLLQQTPHVT
jgi:hypothetical protein